MSSLRRSRHKIRLHPHIDRPELPDGVRILAWARAIRWIGWGFGEALISVFILRFSNTFAEMGLFSATVDIASLVSLPIIGAWADRVSAKYLVLISLLLYPFVGISYLFAGLFSLAIFIVIARMLNGFVWELENIGVETYYRRVVDPDRIATSFGYIETWSHAAWIGASFIGMVLVIFMPIHYLLFAIAPFALIGYMIAKRAPVDTVGAHEGQRVSFVASYSKALEEWRSWDGRLWLLSALVMFSAIISSLIWFFIPIDAYIAGANLSLVILLTVIGSLPSLFSYKLGKLADVRNKYTLIAIGLAGISVISVGLAVFPQYAVKVIACLLLGTILELFYVVESSLITTLGSSDTYGQRGSSFESIVTLGDMTAPLIIGVGLDVMGFSNLSFVIAVGALTLAAGYHFVREQ